MAVTGLVELAGRAVGLLAVTGLALLTGLTGAGLTGLARLPPGPGRGAVAGLRPTLWEPLGRRRVPAGLLPVPRLRAELAWLLAKLTRLRTVGIRLLRRDGHHFS
ncbi:hypothetical protein [Saccharothrix xinjiangensis]|uniref:Uncharacterized protein n=1 Tax=Saccharothrix xinjiangensis TaxID=204798 RepID=A0ABV9XSU1_9PSEU